MGSEEALKKLADKFKLLEIKDKQTLQILSDNRERELKRHMQAIFNRLEELYTLRSSVEDCKIEENEDPLKVEEWGAEFEEKAKHYEQVVEELTNAIETLEQHRERTRIENERREEELRLQKRFEEEQRIEEMKLRLREQYEKKHGEEKNPTHKEHDVKVKLPKLTITKFNGTPIDWMRFWNQFSAEIDKTKISNVSKFSYLKELLDSKVRLLVDGLPFTSEGYERAKSILQSKFGKPSEIITAHVKGIMDLPIINGANPVKIHEFYEKLLTHVQAMETMGKLKTINGYVRLLLDRLPGIRSDLVRNDDDWDRWEFTHLAEALRKWTERNPIASEKKDYNASPRKFDRTLQTNQKQWKVRKCAYCGGDSHKPSNCSKISSAEARREVVSKKRLCFNCLGSSHRAAECRSKQGCMKCGSRHHTSICDKLQETAEQTMMTSEIHPVTYPVVVVKVNGIKCRALLDTGAGSSYASATLIKKLGINASRTENRKIEMMMHTTARKIQIYNLKITNCEENFEIYSEVSKVDKSTLLSVANPSYDSMIKRYQHLTGVRMMDTETKSELPIHLVLGASEYSRIKTPTKPRIGELGDPVAEYTRFGWTIISPGAEVNLANLYLTRSTSEDYDRLCRLDVLGIEHSPAGDQQSVYEDFKDQLSRSEEGWYETGLLWKVGHPPLPTNKKGSLGRLLTLLRRLKRQPTLYEDYHGVIQEYL